MWCNMVSEEVACVKRYLEGMQSFQRQQLAEAGIFTAALPGLVKQGWAFVTCR